tara:strand:- start:155 stop:376 length:222 start_codon:yes stop_codon:yes gene_type:complete
MFPISEEVFTGLILNKLAIKKLLSSLPQGNWLSIPDCRLESHHWSGSSFWNILLHDYSSRHNQVSDSGIKTPP